MNTQSCFQRATYLTSAANPEQLPEDTGSEIAFIGRSNAGKSSALNTITGIKGLARTSKTPGRTQTIIFFDLDEDQRLVDLPGYGYAKVPLTIKKRWEETVDQYLQTRTSLKGLVLVMDIRHPLKDMDQQLIAWTQHCGIPTHILLTKADKLKPSQLKQAKLGVEKALAEYSELVTIQTFSSLNKTGTDSVKAKLVEWLEPKTE